MTTETLHFESARAAQQVFGGDERNLRSLEQELGVKATVRDGMIRLDGEADAVASAKNLFNVLGDHIKAGNTPRARDFAHALHVARHDGNDALQSLFDQKLATSTKKAPVYPKTVGQRKYVEAIRDHDATFGIGWSRCSLRADG